MVNAPLGFIGSCDLPFMTLCKPFKTHRCYIICSKVSKSIFYEEHQIINIILFKKVMKTLFLYLSFVHYTSLLSKEFVLIANHNLNLVKFLHLIFYVRKVKVFVSNLQ